MMVLVLTSIGVAIVLGLIFWIWCCRGDGNKTVAALALKDAMKRSKGIGHSGPIASSVGIYPA